MHDFVLQGLLQAIPVSHCACSTGLMHGFSRKALSSGFAALFPTVHAAQGSCTTLVCKALFIKFCGTVSQAIFVSNRACGTGLNGGTEGGRDCTLHGMLVWLHRVCKSTNCTGRRHEHQGGFTGFRLGRGRPFTQMVFACVQLMMLPMLPSHLPIKPIKSSSFGPKGH